MVLFNSCVISIEIVPKELLVGAGGFCFVNSMWVGLENKWVDLLTGNLCFFKSFCLIFKLFGFDVFGTQYFLSFVCIHKTNGFEHNMNLKITVF